LLAVLSIVAERATNLIKLRDEVLRVKKTEYEKERERESGIAMRTFVFGIAFAVFLKADFFEIMSRMDEPWKTLGWVQVENYRWMRSAASATLGGVIYALVGCMITGISLGFGSKFWHDVLGAVYEVRDGWLLHDDDLAWQLRSTLQSNTEDSWDVAKQHIFNEVDLEQPGGTIHCRYSGTVVTLVDDGGVLRPDSADGVEVEHTWASSAIWAHPDDRFERASVKGADLHNLFPVRQGINGSRGNHPFGELPETARELRIDPDGTLAHAAGEGTPSGSFRDRNDDDVVVFEPREDHKGNVARAMFYMSVRYWMPIPDEMEEDLRIWNRDDPADDDEIARNGRIEAIQGNRNPFVDIPDLIDQIADL
jgi:endonuclease I